MIFRIRHFSCAAFSLISKAFLAGFLLTVQIKPLKLHGIDLVPWSVHCGQKRFGRWFTAILRCKGFIYQKMYPVR
jgi:hypothetical protein